VSARIEGPERCDTVSGGGGLVVLAVDDETPALDEIRYLLARDNRVAAVLTATDATAALRMLQDPGVRPPDAVLLDIRMPGLDGVELARVLAGMRRPPAVAFLSAHDDRAVDAYEVGAVDYLLKPVSADRLAQTVGRLAAATNPSPGGHPPPDGGGDGVIAVELAGTTTFVQRSDVRWAEAQGDYARLHLDDGGSHLLRTPLAVLQEEWGPAGFVRVHRGYLVALHRIVELRATDTGYRIRVSGGRAPADLPVSRRHLRELKDRLFSGRRPGR
jgi:DNA-binding LytR/AlgR family response regulator